MWGRWGWMGVSLDTFCFSSHLVACFRTPHKNICHFLFAQSIYWFMELVLKLFHPDGYQSMRKESVIQTTSFIFHLSLFSFVFQFLKENAIPSLDWVNHIELLLVTYSSRMSSALTIITLLHSTKNLPYMFVINIFYVWGIMRFLLRYFCPRTKNIPYAEPFFSHHPFRWDFRTIFALALSWKLEGIGLKDKFLWVCFRNSYTRGIFWYLYITSLVFLVEPHYKIS